MTESDKEGLSPYVWKITAIAGLGSLLAQLDATIVNVSLSTLSDELNSSLSTIHWVTSGYLLALTLVMPLSGWLMERIGGKKLYILCFSTFTFSSALCGTAWSAGSLITFRLIQGLSGGLLAPMAQMVIARAAGNQFARFAGYAAFPILLGPLIGPAIAGVVLHYASWRWLFYVNVPVSIVALLLVIMFLPQDSVEKIPRELDWLGLGLLSPCLVLFLLGTEKADLWLIAAAASLLMIFIHVEIRKDSRALIDISQFKNNLFSVASIAQFFSNGVTFAGQMLIPLFLIDVYHQSPAAVGLQLVPLGLGMMISIPNMGYLTKKFGIRSVAICGALLSVAGTLAILTIAVYGMNNSILTFSLLIRGMGIGALGLPAITAVYTSIDKKNIPMATTTLNIIQRLGGPSLTTVCAVFLTKIQLVQEVNPTVNTWAYAFLLLSFFHIVTLITSLALPQGKNFRH
ncbi:DHA2 family efflux MFS transporter permease subunit [Kosakonia sp. MUSA4]|uniref:DHA2 family efflux MFS transporter permease subunit n=1 Tax=Kosakonia sp. MUSA4 TaxID=2067958 RepID=UPI0015976AE7|nr:DHA2 family efflux MFS transporter permease subunit [Kosakonia sp. MUSA4]QJT79332.1 MFS transporter [Kosakonia sp. MUSA4]